MTSERTVLRQMDIVNAFDTKIPIPTVASIKELNEMLNTVQTFENAVHRSVVDELKTITRGRDVMVGIKKILAILEISRQDEEITR